MKKKIFHEEKRKKEFVIATVAKVSRKRELWLVVSVNKISAERIEKEIGVMDREAAKKALQSEKASGFFKEMYGTGAAENEKRYEHVLEEFGQAFGVFNRNGCNSDSCSSHKINYS